MLKPRRSDQPPALPLGSAPAEAPGDWRVLSEAHDDAGYCVQWLAILCAQIPGITSAQLWLKPADAKQPVIATWPETNLELTDLAALADRAISAGRTAVSLGRSGHGTSQSQSVGLLVAVPLVRDGWVSGVVSVALSALHGASSVAPETIAEQIRCASGWLEARLLAKHGQNLSRYVERIAIALDVLALASSHSRLTHVAFALVNEIASRLACDRVSLGTASRSGKVRLRAISQSTNFKRQSPLVQGIEKAMEEALDQGTSVSVPALDAAGRTISRAHHALLKIEGEAASSAITVPLISGKGHRIGALTLQRHAKEFDHAELQLAEATATLIEPHLSLQLRSERIFAGQIVDGASDAVLALTGPRRPALKLAALLIGLFAPLLLFTQADHRVSAKAVLEGQVQRAIVAPFDGFIRQAAVRAGDVVRKGDVLARLDDRDLILDRAKWDAERNKLLQQQRDALAKHDRTNIVILKSQLDQAEAQLALVEEKITRSKIVAPFDGLVVSGDLSQTLGAPVERGKVLFEAAPLESYRLIIHVDERDAAYVAGGQSGRVALTGLPGERLPFTVTRVTPVTVPEEGQNAFRVEANVDVTGRKFRPGMEGVAKIEAGSRSLLWVWTHSTVAWVRLALWKYLP